MGTLNENEVRITIRLPQELHKRLVEFAKHERRSLNSEMVTMLERVASDRWNVQPDVAAELDNPNSLDTVMAPLKERNYKRVNDPRKSNREDTK